MSDTPRRHYYVSVMNGPRKALLAGPYPTHADAITRVRKVRLLAEEVDAMAWFYAFGTAGSDLPHRTRFGVVE